MMAGGRETGPFIYAWFECHGLLFTISAGETTLFARVYADRIFFIMLLRIWYCRCIVRNMNHDLTGIDHTICCSTTIPATQNILSGGIEHSCFFGV